MRFLASSSVTELSERLRARARERGYAVLPVVHANLFGRPLPHTTGTYGIVIDNISGSATFSNTKLSGTPSGGLSNPTTTLTIVRGPGNSGF